MTTFETWVQARLVAHGHNPGPVGGSFGVRSREALKAFQRANGLPVSGVADTATVSALRKHPENETQPVRAAPAETMPPWMAEMYRKKGLHEVRDNAALSAWLRIGKFLGNPARLPWCGDAIESAIVKTLPDEPVPDNPFWAQGWARFGVRARPSDIGAIGVIRWSAKAGHVGIVAEYDSRHRRVKLLGGNQSNSIRLDWFDLDDFIAFRWPRTYPMKAYPALVESGASGSKSGTR